jgi:zinc transport system permease protein
MITRRMRMTMVLTGTDMGELFWRAVIGAAALGLAAGPIGCFVLWRRMAYLGSSIAEMALLGVALGLILGISPLAGVLATSLVVALVLARPWARRGAQTLRERGFLPADTRIGLVGHAGLALGFVLLATMETVRADLLGYLFGDVLALSNTDVVTIVLVACAALAVLAGIWRRLLADTVNPDILAAEEGSAKGAIAETIFLVLIAVLIAFGLKVVGALLMVALLLIPPAAARVFARTPEAMAVMAALLGALAAPLGLFAAFAVDAPAGPAIVLAAVSLFALLTLAARLVRR